MNQLTIRTFSFAFGMSLSMASVNAEQVDQESIPDDEEILIVDHGVEQTHTSEPEVIVTEKEPARIYVESNGRTYRSTKANEHCEYQEELDRIYCYNVEPTRRVYVEESTIYRTTRPKHVYRAGYDPIATGVGVGLAIGIPLLVHHSYDRHYRKHRHYNRYGYKNRYYYGNRGYYGHKGYRGYKRGYYRGYKDGYRHSYGNKRKHYFKYGKYRY